MADKRIPVARIREVWLDGRLTTVEAARQVGLTRANLWRRAKALGLPSRKEGRHFAIADEAEFARLYRAGAPVAELARRFGVSPPTISYRARSLGLPKRRAGGSAPRFDRVLACRMWAGGVGTATITAYLGIGPDAVSRAERMAGLPPRPHGFRGLTIAEFVEAELARAMAEAAAQTHAEMQRRGLTGQAHLRSAA